MRFPSSHLVALAALLAGAAPTVAQEARVCDYGAPHPDAPAELAQFDFLIGDYEISLHAWQGGAWTPPRPVGARWNGRYALDGWAIQDEWFDPPSVGVNVRLFDPDEGLWKMMWIAEPTRVVQDLRAELRDGVLTMWQVHPERTGWKAEFERIDADRWARVSYVQDAATGEWTPQFRLAATRVPCEA